MYMCIEQVRNVRKIILAKLEEKTPVGRPGSRRQDKIKIMHVKKTGGREFIEFTWLRIEAIDVVSRPALGPILSLIKWVPGAGT
jgi:hypothetical protein